MGRTQENELESAVSIALDVIARGKQGTNLNAFVDVVLTEAAEKTKGSGLDGAAQAADDALIELDRQEAEQRKAIRRKRILILEAAVRQHMLRRDAAAVVELIERLIAEEHATERPAWHLGFRVQYDEYRIEGEDKGLNFSLEIAIECARRMIATARDSDERGTAAILLGTVLSRLGERESGTAWLEEAVNIFHAALEEWTRERVPLDWARTQNSLGFPLRTLGERESGAARLEAAISAYRAALEE
ncbi:MAG: hypothetical protein JO227_07650 [Acetobacteraceae bacterium]|nr:hypothetical protein [Acetobacteraceae bacterium]